MLDLAHVLPLLAERAPDATAVIGPVTKRGAASAALLFRLSLRPSQLYDVDGPPGILWDFTDVVIWAGPGRAAAAPAIAAARAAAAAQGPRPADVSRFVGTLDEASRAAWAAGQPPVALLQVCTHSV